MGLQKSAHPLHSSRIYPLNSLTGQVVLTDYPEAALIDNLKFNVTENLTPDEQDRVDIQVFFET